MSCSLPNCAIYEAYLKNIRTGEIREIDMDFFQLSWERNLNQTTEFVLTPIDGYLTCCPWGDLDVWCWELHIFRDKRRVAVNDFYKIISNPDSGLDVLYFTSRMNLVARRIWLKRAEFNYEATDAFERILNEADECDPLAISRQAVPTGINAEMNVYADNSLSQDINNLSSGFLDWTEFSLDDDLNVVRYGDIYYETGVTLTEKDWTKGIPTTGIDGDEKSNAVIVISSANSDNNVVGYYPRNSDGSLKKDFGGKRWLPTVIVVNDLASKIEANLVAEKNYRKLRTGRVITTGNSAELSSNFSYCLDELIPGAIFDVDLDTCTSMNGRYVLEGIEFNVDGGLENGIKISLSELSDS